MRTVVVVLSIILFCVGALGQQPAVEAKAAPQARAEDVQSVDAIIKSLYAVISGEKGKARDWDRFRSLFVPGARLMPTRVDAEGKRSIRVLTPDE